MTTLAKISLCAKTKRTEKDTLKCPAYPNGIPKVTDQFGHHIDGSVCDTCPLFENSLLNKNK